jgi:glutamate/aspartate transport system permease protein
MYLAVAVIYMVLSSLTSQLVAILKNRYAVPGRR